MPIVIFVNGRIRERLAVDEARRFRSSESGNSHSPESWRMLIATGLMLYNVVGP